MTSEENEAVKIACRDAAYLMRRQLPSSHGAIVIAYRLNTVLTEGRVVLWPYDVEQGLIAIGKAGELLGSQDEFIARCYGEGSF